MPAVDRTVPLQLVYVTTIQNRDHPVDTTTAVNGICNSWLIPEYRAFSYGHLTISPCTVYGYFDLNINNGDPVGTNNAVSVLIGNIPANTVRIITGPPGIVGNATTYGNFIIMPGGGPYDHEFGHAIGYGHAASQTWANNVATGTIPQGDPGDLMGQTGIDLNAFYRDYSHWFDATRQLLTVTTPQTLTLDSLRSTTPGIKALKFALPTGTYYVEHYPTFQGGPPSVKIHKAGGNLSILEDIDKVTAAIDYSLDFEQTYCFDTSGTCVTNQGYGSGVVTIAVTVGGSTPSHAAPSTDAPRVP